MIDIRTLDNRILESLLNDSIKNINGAIKDYSKDEIYEALKNDNNYVNIISKIDDKEVILETPYINESLDSMIGKYETIEEVQQIINNICYDYKLLMETINIGIQMPQRISIEESYNKELNAKFKKYGQGLKNVYDYMIYKIL